MVILSERSDQGILSRCGGSPGSWLYLKLGDFVLIFPTPKNSVRLWKASFLRIFLGTFNWTTASLRHTKLLNPPPKKSTWPYYNDQPAEVTLNGGLVRESTQNGINSGLGIILICPDQRTIWYKNPGAVAFHHGSLVPVETTTTMAPPVVVLGDSETQWRWWRWETWWNTSRKYLFVAFFLGFMGLVNNIYILYTYIYIYLLILVP